uniref:Uncharacterized protein n=1 Tax=Arundo donax TaxID=35708 RepID=A0A0A9FCN7_ARUDO
MQCRTEPEAGVARRTLGWTAGEDGRRGVATPASWGSRPTLILHGGRLMAAWSRSAHQHAAARRGRAW